MTTYTYQLLRYLPNQANGEFVNIGLVLSSAVDDYFRVEVIRSYQRAKSLYPALNITQLRRVVEALRGSIQAAGKEWLANTRREATFTTEAIVPYDDSALSFTKPAKSLGTDPAAYFDYLYELMVQPMTAEKTTRTSNERVWKESFESIITRYINKRHFQKQEIKTGPSTSIKFDHAIKNGTWHYLEPVAWDLKDERRVVDKLYKYQGRIRELAEAKKQDAHIYLLSQMPSNTDLRQRIENGIQQLTVKGLTVRLVKPEEAHKLGRELKQAIVDHNN